MSVTVTLQSAGWAIVPANVFTVTVLVVTRITAPVSTAMAVACSASARWLVTERWWSNVLGALCATSGPHFGPFLFALLLQSWHGRDIIGLIMAKKNNTKRKLVGLVSEESGVRAYYTKKNTMNTPDKLSLRKYDPVLRKHVVFTETKKNLGRNEVKEKKR